MQTFADIINEIVKIREAIDGIEVKGNQNSALVCYAYSKCNELINALNETAKKIQEEQNQNGSEQPEIILTEVGEENAENDSGMA